MRLKDSYLSSIVYLGLADAEHDGRIHPEGTGFLVSYDDATYIVTAAHVARGLTDCAFGVRLNRASDGMGEVDRIEEATWYQHPDDTVDVAVMPYDAPKWARVKWISGKSIMSEFKRETKKIGVGDLAYVVGIFKAVRARDKNVPIVHTGHIASMADGEPLLTQDWRKLPKAGERTPLLEVEGFLVQAHTMRQASGSPVFVRRSIDILVTERAALAERLDSGKVRVPLLAAGVHGSVWLLGLWHGAWVNDVSTLLDVAEGSVTLGTGMGICIPAPKIIESLEQAELKNIRDCAKRNR